MLTYFDVGMNDGSDTVKWLEKHPDSIVYGFEPTPQLYVDNKIRFRSNQNVKIFPFAIDIVNGYSMFNIAGIGDWGCSSLYDFTDGLDEKWPGRWDFKFTEKTIVPTIRLDTFIEMMNLNNTNIDYMWMDIQGNDLNGLKSLGKYIWNVVAGRCEAAYTLSLYKNTHNDYKDVVRYLEQYQFKNIVITPDPPQKECNISFSRNAQ